MNYFGYDNEAHLLRIQERHYLTLRLLTRFGYARLEGARILDVGCGDGPLLRQFAEWTGTSRTVFGVDVAVDRLRRGHTINSDIRLVQASATQLPWPDESFDVVCQHTVFTSVVDPVVRTQMAREIMRVVRRGGAVLWYDFTYNNPRNPAVRAVTRRDLMRLFPEFHIAARRVTLAPPIARRLPTLGRAFVYHALAKFPFLCTHDLALLVRPPR